MNPIRSTAGKRIVYALAVLVAVSLLIIELPRTSYTQTSGELQRAPLNPAFIEYVNSLKQMQMQTNALAVTAQGHGLGLRPRIHTIPDEALAGPQLETLEALQALPSTYDLRTVGKLTPVRNQGSCGDCWAFATYGSLESYLMPGESRDFSEADLNVNNGFAYGACNGGFIDMSVAYLARWSGPLNESLTGGVQKHLQNAYYFPGLEVSGATQTVKQAVMNYGAVYVSMYWGDSYLNTNYSYNCTVATSPNHAVCIVGWNDSYSASKFKSVPAGNGAWIVRNSWGSGWGDGGYFYVSYYDKDFGRVNIAGQPWGDPPTAVTAEQPDNHDGIYQYDPLGWCNSVGYPNGSTPTTAWGANIFAATSSSPITAVGFYAASASTSYAIYIYTGVTAGAPRSGTLQCSLTGTTAHAGYATVDLGTSVPVTNGQKFSVVVKFTTPGYDYPVPFEAAYSNYSPAATASPGQSYLSEDGTSWADATQSLNTMNVCIKAYSGEAAPPVSITVSSPALGASWYRGSTQDVVWSTAGYSSANVAILLMEGSSLVKTIASAATNNGTFSWTIPGTTSAASDYFVRIMAPDGSAQGDSGLFSIVVPTLSVTSPTSGDAWYRGETHTITWNSGGTSSANVKIQLYHGTTLTKTLASAVPNTGTFDWAIPKTIGARNDYYVKITATTGGATGKSATFAIMVPTITVTSPTAVSSWTRGSSLAINWTPAGPQSATVSIVLLRSGVVKATIASSTANSGTLSWPIPTGLAAGSGYTVRIKTADGLVKGLSGKFNLN